MTSSPVPIGSILTEPAQGRRPASYLASLDKDGLKGARIRVLRQLFAKPDADPAIVMLLERALADMKRQGAQIVEGVNIPEIDQIPSSKLGCDRFRQDINAYLADLGPQAPMKSLANIIASGKFHPSIQKNLLDSQAALPPDQNPSCLEAVGNRLRFARGVLKSMDDASLDAVVYPTWNNPLRLIGDLNSPHGNNSNILSPPTGFPALTVPMGFVGGTLPAGLQILGRPWSEPTLFRIAYAYEQATWHRRPPASTPTLQ